MNDRIDIALATFNGERFLQEQLESFAAQSHRNWRLVVGDDGSSDRTLEIVRQFQMAHPEQVLILEGAQSNLGPSQNFSRIMCATKADYVALSDQDDVWQKDKLEVTLAKLKQIERQISANKPSLVFSDLAVVAEDLTPIHSSLWSYRGYDPDHGTTMGRLLPSNTVTGCTVLINRSLCELATPIPATVNLHDWWLALCATAFGHIDYVAAQTVSYRQHLDNIIGAGTESSSQILGRSMSVLMDSRAARDLLRERFLMISRFRKHYEHSLGKDKMELLNDFLDIPACGIFRRLIRCYKLGCLPKGFLRSALFIWLATPSTMNGAKLK